MPIMELWLLRYGRLSRISSRPRLIHPGMYRPEWPIPDANLRGRFKN